MPDLYFPTVPGLSWSVLKAPKFSTRIQHGVSGRELRAVDQPIPIWNFTLTYEVLRDKNDFRQPAPKGLGSLGDYDELRTLMGFYLMCQGSFGTFLYEDPTDNHKTNMGLATGNGVMTEVPLFRVFGGFYEPVIAPNLTGTYPFSVYLDGVYFPGEDNYSVSNETGIITFVNPPADGVAISVDFHYFFRCRFTDDSAEFENFLFQLWNMKTLKFQSVLL